MDPLSFAISQLLEKDPVLYYCPTFLDDYKKCNKIQCYKKLKKYNMRFELGFSTSFLKKK